MAGAYISADNVSKAIRKLISGMRFFLMKTYRNEYPPTLLWLNISVQPLI
jgi:hypothetical protein